MSPMLNECCFLERFVRVLMMLVLCGRFVTGCFIHGADIGYCETSFYNDGKYRKMHAPFCASFVTYPACVPKYDPLPPSREFEDGRWINNTVAVKDKWVQELYEIVVKRRLGVEGNRTLQKRGIDEYGNRGSPVPRFTKNDDCQKAYKAYMCYINFPRCDDDGNSLMTCRSACENLMVACQNQKDLWRCGESEYFNGYEPEEPEIDSNGDPVYYRDFFPGQPFRDVEWARGRQPKIICTPSIKGAAPSSLRPLGTRGLGLIIPVAIIMATLLDLSSNGSTVGDII